MNRKRSLDVCHRNECRAMIVDGFGHIRIHGRQSKAIIALRRSEMTMKPLSKVAVSLPIIELETHVDRRLDETRVIVIIDVGHRSIRSQMSKTMNTQTTQISAVIGL